MMEKIYVISIRWVTTNLSPTTIDATLTRFGDWIRFNGYCWFVETNSTAADISSAIRLHLSTDDSVIVVEVDPGVHAGWSPPFVWDWLRKKAAKRGVLNAMMLPRR
jgi:hypothetical protein